ncbi:primosomal protein DnaI [Thermoactinomyces intermedius]|jgi:primosomal protein DnaI|uniref:Primosomal protein DnaI n=1 Tax=Thermoactinomyces intermedius TaxID=2024 RepID=A0A8I1DFH7_THEIN|nr:MULTISPECIES: primosomal protein DnaI [Thermoactinomyces]MBA4549492.1 primosomal protein DnaI [Thermoactinomyces intermedius]MBA4836925.1 primosomal protein DnaI [Thermoactinomyces intermedius]MBH8594856.1 primosomal protein DnaI [Thermoactinomyces intermedius]MBH8602338.1 primosomal protein DnaI [Thermoactinomyces sp. CICC 23799]
MKRINNVMVPVGKNLKAVDKERQLKLLLQFPLVEEFRKQHPELPTEVYQRSFSFLQQFVMERSNCQQCPGLDRCPNMMKGHYPELDEYGGYLDLTMHECSKWKAEKQKSLIQSHYISKEIQQSTFERIDYDHPERNKAILTAMDYCISFKESPLSYGLYLYGAFGVGKSYIAGAITNELAKHNISSIMVHFPALVEELKASIADNQISRKIEALKTTQVLILDDIGAESLTPWLRDEVLSVILQRRMTDQRPTIYTSNMTLDELEEHFSYTAKGGWEILKAKRLMERIRPFVQPVLVQGRNRRYPAE